MFEAAELGRSVSKKDFKKAEAPLREELLELQDELRRGRHFQTILVFAGVDGGGKGETVALLNEWMDPRWLQTRAYDAPSQEEAERPEYWRYWRDLPPRGRIGMFLSSWYSKPVLDLVYGASDETDFVRDLNHILAFERALAQGGALILKFWMHLSRTAQEERFKSLERDPLTKARVTARDWENWKRYDSFVDAAEQLIAYTNRGLAPWSIVEGVDPNYRGLTVTTTLRDHLHQRLAEAQCAARRPTAGDAPTKAGKKADKPHAKNAKKAKGKAAGPHAAAADTAATHAVSVLSALDMAQTIEKESYQAKLPDLQARLHRLHLRAKAEGVSTMLIFEGPDAAGKGGTIRRIHEALDPRNYQVHGIAAPSDEESAQHYLWRFWRRLPRAGRIGIFDRTWYGRVLVERIEGFAEEAEWRRAYAEINDFETQLIEHGIVLVKYWLHITKDEQLARFKEREKTPHKRWKLTEEDWRNRERWDDYEQAVNDMIQYTSTRHAPWTLVAGNDKRFARIKVLETYCERLASALGADPEEAA